MGHRGGDVLSGPLGKNTITEGGGMAKNEKIYKKRPKLVQSWTQTCNPNSQACHKIAKA